MPFRIPHVGRTAGVLLCLLVIVVVGAALFDWNWFRHPLERYLIHRSHREVRIGDLHVDLASSFEPTVRVRDVYVENAPWADRTRPAAVVGEASITFSLKSVWEGRPVVSRLVLIDADVDLERQADGRRNWRLRNPEDRSPGRLKVLRLEAHRTKVRFIRRDIELVVVAIATPSEPDARGRLPDATHPTRISFNGDMNGVKFSGDLATGETLTFLETGEPFPMRGHASAVESRLEVDGTVADLFQPSAIDAKVRLAGPSLAKLRPFFRTSLPPSRPYEIEARFRQGGGDTSFADVRGKIGNTDVAGTVGIDLSNKRPLLRAVLRSESTDISDLDSLVGADHSSDNIVDKAKAAHGERAFPPGNSGQDGSKRGTPKRLIPDIALNSERLGAFDAHVTLDVRKLRAAELPELRSLRVTADLKNGFLALRPIDFGLAGGHVAGSFTLDGRQKPPAAITRLEFKDVRLERLLDRLSTEPAAAGPLSGYIDLKGRGTSVAKLVSGSSGSAGVTMEGGVISNLLDAKLGLNGGKILRLLITGDRAIGVRRGVIAFDFEKGFGKSKTILLDTEQTQTEGMGVIDLRDETVDILLTPHPKKASILALRSSIRVHGPIRQPTISLQKKAEGAGAANREQRGVMGSLVEAAHVDVCGQGRLEGTTLRADRYQIRPVAAIRYPRQSNPPSSWGSRKDEPAGAPDDCRTDPRKRARAA